MNKSSKATPFSVWWSVMAGGVMVAENPEIVHIFLPYEIVEVNTVGDNLFVIARPHMEGQVCSFTLSPESALPSVAERAQNSGLPIAQYAASKIRYAKDEQQLEDQRLNALPQAFCHEASPSFEDQSLSITRNRLFIVFPIMISALFAAMVMIGGTNTSLLLIIPQRPHARRHRSKRRSWVGELIPKPEEGEGNRNSFITIETFHLIGYLILHDCSESDTTISVSG